MAITGKSLIVLLSIAMASAGDKDKPPFKPGPVDSYAFRQTLEKVTVAAALFRSDTETAPAFGKLNPNRYGILPVLVVIRNGGATALSLEAVLVEYITESRNKIEATPARDVPRTLGSKQPKEYSAPLPIPRTSRGKNPLAAWEIEGRAFSAKMLPPGQSASGFFYFQAPHHAGSVLYITGIREAASGRELFYFEIPLDK
jgi:hypothetical protein